MWGFGCSTAPLGPLLLCHLDFSARRSEPHGDPGVQSQRTCTRVCEQTPTHLCFAALASASQGQPPPILAKKPHPHPY